MQEKTQKQIVADRIKEVGYIDNFFAIHNYILRLGAIVFELRRAGMDLRGAFGKELGKERSEWKNYYYVLVKKEQGKMFDVPTKHEWCEDALICNHKSHLED